MDDLARLSLKKETLLDIDMAMGLEQLVDFPTRQENTLDLIFTSHPRFKIRCKPLQPIGQKSDHDIALLDTTHQPLRTRPPRRKIMFWKKADTEKIKQHLKEWSQSVSRKHMNIVQVCHLISNGKARANVKCPAQDQHIHR